MSTFPRLKTGAILQYPGETVVSFATTTCRFVDGTEQRFRASSGALRRWAVNLEMLDESELVRIERFFREQQGSFGTFQFTDPIDNTEYANCSLESDELVFQHEGEMLGSTQLVVRQNR
jgi:hypothetical protein